MNKFYEVGEKFKLEGKKYNVVADTLLINSCIVCSFFHTDCPKTECQAPLRKDETEVHFQEVNKC